MSNFIDNLCALLTIEDRSRVKIVGVYAGSVIVQTVILPPLNATDNSTSNSTTSSINSTEPTLAEVKQILDSMIGDGTYVDSMQNITGYSVISTIANHYKVESGLEDSSVNIKNLGETSNAGMVIGIIVASVVGVGLVILIIYLCKRWKNNQIVDES